MADSTSIEPPSEPHAPTCVNPFTDQSDLGIPSKIHEYCIDPQRRDQECIWLCRRQHRSGVAWDVPVDDVEKGAISLRKLLGHNAWWSRFAFYNCIGVRHVQIKFLGSQRDSQGFLVVPRDVIHSEAVATMRRELENTNIPDLSGCGVDKKGNRHAEGDRNCDNVGDDQEGYPYCIVLAYARLDSKMQKWMWMPQMLDYFWTKDVEEDGLEFLKGSGFVWTYRDLAYETFGDAADPYGKTVDALELVSGWRIRRLLWTILAAIVIDICIVAIVTLLTGSGETGLAAGSYAAAIEALLMALLTLLGAVLQ